LNQAGGRSAFALALGQGAGTNAGLGNAFRHIDTGAAWLDPAFRGSRGIRLVDDARLFFPRGAARPDRRGSTAVARLTRHESDVMSASFSRYVAARMIDAHRMRGERLCARR